MTDRFEDDPEIMQQFQLFSDLATAISEWYGARQRFQNDPRKQLRDAYCKATDELGQALSQWWNPEPEFLAQLRLGSIRKARLTADRPPPLQPPSTQNPWEGFDRHP